MEPGLFRLDRDTRTKFLYTACTRAESRLAVFRGG
jgi:hypothetical protein